VCLAAVLLAGVLLLYLSTLRQASAEPDPALHGCLYYDDDVVAETNRPATFGVEARYDVCNRYIRSRLPEGDGPARLPSMSAYPFPPELLDGRPQILLESATFDGQIRPITRGALGDDDVGRWTWEILPSSPGEQRLSLTFSVLDMETGRESLYEERQDVVVHVRGTFGYYVRSATSALLGFATSLRGGIVLSGAAAVVALLFGLRRARLRKRRPVSTGERGPSASPRP
jgi:hypothetical protein